MYYQYQQVKSGEILGSSQPYDDVLVQILPCKLATAEKSLLKKSLPCTSAKLVELLV